jgi:ribosomal protein S18 acetylase RimI-like enzyme
VSSDIVVREAGESDALCLHALGTQVFLDTYAKEGIREAIAREAQQELSVTAFLEQLTAPRVRTLLAERSGFVVAFASVTLGATHPLVAKGPGAELSRLYVQSPFIRQGVGSLLLRHVEALARAGGASTLWLTAWVGNARALAFYASQGYEERGSTDHEFEGERFENRLFARDLAAGTELPCGAEVA